MKYEKSKIDYEELKQELKISKGYVVFMVNNSPCFECEICGGSININNCKLLVDSTLETSKITNGVSTLEIAMMIDNYLTDNIDVLMALKLINGLKGMGILIQKSNRKNMINR